MRKYKFYLIISKKSEEIINGLKKYTLGCENRADSHGFFWTDNAENIKQIQLIFGETVIEWFEGKWIEFSMTNRSVKALQVHDSPNGSRILHPVDSNNPTESILDKARNAEYPMEWDEKIMEKF